MTLINGQTVENDRVKFNSKTYVFTYNSPDGNTYDITELVYRADKKLFPGFDNDVEGMRIYNMNYAANHGAAAPVLNTDTAQMFMTNVANSVKPVLFGTTAIALLIGGLYLYFVVLKPSK